METKERTLICFTSSYPYGTRETYFENELQYLAKEFKKVYIQPTYNPFKTHAERNIPANVVVLKDPLVPASKQARTLQGILNTSSVSLFMADFFKNKPFRSKDTFIEWVNGLLVHRISYTKVKKLLQGFDKDVVLYSYWASAPYFASDLCKPYKKIVRMHGGDFYLDRHNGYLPVRSDIYRSADLLVPISDNISSILENHYKINRQKIYVNRLGIDNKASTCTLNENPDVIRVVSCSHIYPLKRVQLIAEALHHWKGPRQIEWHHFGAGADLEKIKKIGQSAGEKVTVHMHGAVSQAELYSFYQNNYVHWFVNVSTSEGIPVSIMEAFSSGVPAIATNVGGTSEIVTAQNGYLISKDFDLKEFAGLLNQVDEGYRLKRVQALNTWLNKYRAETNFTEMVNKIHSL